MGGKGTIGVGGNPSCGARAALWGQAPSQGQAFPGLGQSRRRKELAMGKEGTVPKLCYEAKDFKPATTKVIAQANQIINQYAAQGYDLTLRQLYYQFVARGWLENRLTEYKRLGDIINDARVAGLVDWDRITDRTRNLHRLPQWDSPEAIVDTCAEQYREDLWASQRFRPEVWIEKEALSGVFQRICDELRVPFFACRGYCSQSEMWAASQRLLGYEFGKQTPIIFHFGDHDPSGIDMTGDIKRRMKLFRTRVKVKRIALTMEQVEEHNPPPNPAKVTDSRFNAYQEEHGDESWELDALDPDTLAGLVREQIDTIRDDGPWEDAVEKEQQNRAYLANVAGNWEAVRGFLDGGE